MEKRLKILLIDDDEVDREIIRKSLKSLDPHITESMTGSDALMVAKSQEFDLILLDYKLPDIDGLLLIYEMRKVTKNPIIVITGFGNEDVVKATNEAGVIDYIPKNRITPEFLTRSILNDLLIYKTQSDKKQIEDELMRQKEENLAVLQEIIILANRKIAEYDKEKKR